MNFVPKKFDLKQKQLASQTHLLTQQKIANQLSHLSSSDISNHISMFQQCSHCKTRHKDIHRMEALKTPPWMPNKPLHMTHITQLISTIKNTLPWPPKNSTSSQLFILKIIDQAIAVNDTWKTITSTITSFWHQKRKQASHLQMKKQSSNQTR